MALQQFIVPQFIDVEDKIIGPVTVRQFVIMLVALLISALEYRFLSFVFFIPAGLLTSGLGAILAFAKINGRPIHFFLLNFVQTLRNPYVRVWNKESYVRDVQIVKSEIKEKAQEVKPKKPVSGSRLQDISLVLNTGGVYQSEEQSMSDNLEQENIKNKK